MKEKLNRLAKGIIEDELPKALITPESFHETVFAGKVRSYVIGIESPGGRNLKGVCVCDEFRIEFSNASFMGRMSHLNFTVNAQGLPEGHVIAGKIRIISNAGEFSIPYEFTVGPELKNEFQSVEGGQGCEPVPQRGPFEKAESAEVTETLFASEEPLVNRQHSRAEKYLAEHLPEDDELLLDLTTMMIREGETGQLAFAVYQKAIKQGLEVTHLYESFMNAWPDDSPEPLPREILLYYLYEKNIDLSTADKLYSNIIRFEPENSEFYAQMESRMRDHAMKSVLDRRINSHLSIIYDRMMYPDMLDPKAASLLPDLIRSHRIRTNCPEAVYVHVRYPELKKTFSERFTDGLAYIPVYFKNALITLHRADGTQLTEAEFTNSALMSRPDLMRRCFSLDPYHPMLLLSAAREIAGRGARSEEEKQILTNALSELELEEQFRKLLIRVLCNAGGSTDWLDNIPLSDLDAETGSFAFRAFLNSGRFREAYLYLRRSGMEFFDIKDLAGLATSLIQNGEKPVTGAAETDRFFLCLCKYLFDHQAVTPEIMGFLTEEYEGSSFDMTAILKEADRYGISVHDLPERALTVMLFAETRRYLDDVFVIYLKSGEQKEMLLKAFFVFRMTDYFEHGDRAIDPDVFGALESYFQVTRFPESQPEILQIGLTRYYSDLVRLTAAQHELCQKLTDQLIAKELVFSYTKALRKKIVIPASICEKFYVDYMGTKDSEPRMMARILPGETEYTQINMKQVFRNVYVAAVVLFMNEKLCYRLYDDSREGSEAAAEGTIEVRKMHGKDEDRYLWLNRMTQEMNQRNVQGLKDDMMKYAVATEVNRELFRIEET